jgi:flagellum-specific peptidoglycan hydrolase FlgJ
MIFYMYSLKLLTLGLALGAATSVAGQTISRAEYIERYKGIAVEHAEKYGIPASIKMAQGILESGYGNGALARKGNTHFNIKVKASDNWRGDVVYHDDDLPNEAFRAYATPEESWLDHSEYLDTQPRYDSLFRHSVTDYRSWARGLKNAGYATDPLYAEKLVRVIEENRLWELDGEGAALALGQTSGRRGVAALANTPNTGLVDPDRYVVVMQRRERQ